MAAPPNPGNGAAILLTANVDDNREFKVAMELLSYLGQRLLLCRHPSSDKLSFITSHNKLFGGQILAVLFHKLIDIIAIHLQSPDLGQRYNLFDCRLHRVLSQTAQCHICQYSLTKASSKLK
ncbi:hypothetical protein AVEN_160316-1 [Araneus ventricosus]|uniref:Uncharacterized protein n=1 Tax=Araneus ventricosus TaxID=182803 RepID=A0A4Y2FC94_ARAVE|nr:hypothetical protein AVEN_160316-1 [Araneus ventricosus]